MSLSEQRYRSATSDPAPTDTAPTSQSATGQYRLTARYTDDEGTVLMTGLQALARLPIEQLRADRAAGLNTAAMLTGYPGSPLGGFDKAINEAIAVAGNDLAIHHQPGLNEEQAATAVMGSQLACTRSDARFDGVLGIWYGKAPGVDRATDAIRHGVFAGADPRGGAVVIAGDDPAAKSSTIPSTSAGSLAAMHVPVLYPGTPADALRLGRHAIAMSRSTGLWTSLKIVADVADGVSTVTLNPAAVEPVIPTVDGQRYVHMPDGHLLTPRTVETEREIYEVRYELATEYATANGLNEITVDAADAWLGIVTSGITYRELREALRRLGLPHDSQLSDCGIRLLRLDMPIPFCAKRSREFARGLQEILVIEEKHPNVESLLKDALYQQSERPLIVGKRDEQDQLLFAGHGALNADDLIEPLRLRLSARLSDRLIAASDSPSRIHIPVRLELSPVVKPSGTSGTGKRTGAGSTTHNGSPAHNASPEQEAERTPFFCSGCPHNRSVRVPDGAVVGVGIGCHTMALLLRPDQVGDLIGLTSMGQEGTQWVGMAPFVDTPHIFQNLGDGTYFHSGKLAIAGAVAAEVNLTYKLLWNRHVAMTGGQDPQGAIELADVCRNLQSIGVKRILITTDDTSAYRTKDLPDGIEVWDRKRLIEAQELLAQVAGVTVLVHDQQCAAEARRERKRGIAVAPKKKVEINERICEGCGDCAQISNCLSVQPVDTFFGPKTRIDQTTCNLDFSCLEGDCPSFMEVREAGPFRRAVREMFATWGLRQTYKATQLPVAPQSFPTPVSLFENTDSLAVRMCGIGGTGVVTIGQMLGTAALFDGYQSRGLDQIGLSQKAGPVVGDLRISRKSEVATSRVGAKQADLLLAFDQLVASSGVGVQSCEPGHTVVAGSNAPTPTGAMITDTSVKMPAAADLAAELAATSRADAQFWADAAATTSALMGSSVAANVFVVGMAVQCGGLPLSPEAVRHAIELNGVAVAANLAAFNWGRAQIADPQMVAAAVKAANGLAGEPGGEQHGGGHGGAHGGKHGDLLPQSLRSQIEQLASEHSWSGELVAAVTRYSEELVRYQSKRLAARYLDTVARVAQADTAATALASSSADSAAGELTTTPGELTTAAAAGLFKLMAYKDEYEVARLMLDPQATATARRLAHTTDGYAVWMLHPPMLRAIGVDRKIGFSASWRPMFWALSKLRWVRGHWFDPFGQFEVRKTERSLINEYTHALLAAAELASTGQASTGSGAKAWQSALTIAQAPDVVRGYEHIKLENVKHFRAVLAAAAPANPATPATPSAQPTQPSQSV